MGEREMYSQLEIQLGTYIFFIILIHVGVGEKFVELRFSSRQFIGQYAGT